MGVLNVTPDSFSDGGRFVTDGAWSARIDSLLAEGADVIDVGGESTRPGAAEIPAEEQLRRVLDPIRHAVERRAIVSIDTTLPEVADAAVAAGASIINDVSCLRHEGLAHVARARAVHLVVMHSRGSMTKMKGFSDETDDAYEDVVLDVTNELADALARAKRAGVPCEALLADPGLGFHKNARHSFTLLRRLGELARLEVPLVVGASRKSFLAREVPSPAAERIGGSIAAALAAARNGALMVRVHDVRATRQALAVDRAIEGAG
jgi:dihydropteroate synthase